MGINDRHSAMRRENHRQHFKRIVTKGLRHASVSPSKDFEPSNKPYAAALSEDETQVIFMPDIAYCNEAGDVVASLQAWVYRNKPRRRLKHMLAFMCGVDISALDERTRQIFYARTRLFMADCRAGYQLHVRDEKGRRHSLPATRPDGRTHDLVHIPLSSRQIGANQTKAPCVTLLRKIHFQLDGEAINSGSHDITCFFAPPQGVSIISDIDDTIKHSFVCNKKKLLRATFLEDYRPVPEMSAWYQSLAKNAGTAFHYVSSSPIQLYPSLRDFMQTAHYPEGSIHLRETTRLREILVHPKRAKQHKSAVITRLLHSFKQRQFILIGDSSGDDALIYADLARRYPYQIAAICIRDVTPASKPRPYAKIFAEVASDRWYVSDKVDEMRQFITALDIVTHG